MEELFPEVEIGTWQTNEPYDDFNGNFIGTASAGRVGWG
jgi:hypothetical protein